MQHWRLLDLIQVLVPELTCISGGEHDHKGFSDERVCPTGLTAIIIGIAFYHRHSVFPGEGKLFSCVCVLSF